MRSTTRFIALGLAGLALAACKHQDKDAPLAFAPADTPYVIANLEVLDDDTRKALLTQADTQLPLQVAQINAAAERMMETDPDGARLLHALAAEFNGKTIETFAQNVGLDLKGYSALFGIGLAPVLRISLSDTKSFDGFINRMESAYGKKLDVVNLGTQTYRKYTFTTSGTQVVLAMFNKQAVLSLLPADATPTLLRQAIGLDRPAKSLMDDGRLVTLAKDKGYQNSFVGELDLTRALPMIISGTDPLFVATKKARAAAESAKTGEPIANEVKPLPSCAAEASRIAARVPTISFGFTQLDDKHYSGRLDVALAPDISNAFAGLKIDLPGLGSAGTAPFDATIAVPVMQLVTFWSAQADAVSATPFTCAALTDINDGFAKLGSYVLKAKTPPFGDMLGLRIALDTFFPPGEEGGNPKFTGRLLLGTNNPIGLVAMGGMLSPELAQLKLTPNGPTVSLPENLAGMLGQPAWLAMGEKSIALGIGGGEDTKLAELLKAPTGDAGRGSRMHINGAMYLTWVQMMEHKAQSMAPAQDDDETAGNDSDAAKASAKAAADAASMKAQFAVMKAQAARVVSIDAEAHMEKDGLVITNQSTLK